MSEYTIITPLEVYLPRKTKNDKKYALNLNVYRNTCFQVLNQAKKIYNQNLKHEILKLPKFEYLEEVDYIIYKRSLREFDTPNLGSIISKFFMDALVIYGRIPDDNYKITPRHVIDFGGVSPTDYCKIVLKGKVMQYSITLDHEDIIKAISQKFGAQLPAGFINNLKFDIKDGKLSASCACDNPQGHVVQEAPKEPVMVQDEPPFLETPEEKPATETTPRRRRNVPNLAEEFNQVSESSNRETIPEPSNSDDSGDSNSDTVTESDTTSSEETTEVEQVKTNTFGSRSVRRRIV